MDKWLQIRISSDKKESLKKAVRVLNPEFVDGKSDGISKLILAYVDYYIAQAGGEVGPAIPMPTKEER